MTAAPPDDPDDPRLASSSGLAAMPASTVPSAPLHTPASMAAAMAAHATAEVSPTSPYDPLPALAPRRAASVHHARHSTIDTMEPMPMPGAMPGAMPFPADDPPHFDGPSSAPPTPSVISITHPSPFIHTHHPRRGSLTPLGLNVISPVPPSQVSHESSPLRSVGFLPSGGEFTLDPRRDSVASTSSNLTITRPGVSGSRRRSSLTPSLPNLAPPTNFNPSKRRSSLTPSLPTLAAPSPTRALVTARLAGRTAVSDGGHAFLPTHSRTMDSISSTRRISNAHIGDTRRGSLPHLYYGAWTGPGERSAAWNPTLATQRGSVDDSQHPAPGVADPLIDQTFRFGCPPSSAAAGPSTMRAADLAATEDVTASGSLHRIAQIGSARRKEKSAFELAEQEEAERQRRAFLAATYGEDSRRARARLSLGGASGVSPGSPASTRRQSLLLWERMNKPPDGSAGAPAAAAPATMPTGGFAAVPGLAGMQSHTGLVGIPGMGDEFGRRPSLPMNIPARTPPTEACSSFDNQNIWDHPDSLAYLDDTPQRPLPPLLPLSDPVPRLLPSTLALHRATHLLNSRNLAPEPLPAPLPPSLHPPNPVDLSEFDIDFILAGSKTNLGRAGSQSSAKHRTSGGDGPSSTYRKDIVEEEDTFAKFVGAFDDEYGDRRGDWTFRACSPSSSGDIFPISDNELGGPLDTTRPRPRAEWDCHGAGRFEIYPNGDVRSVESGAVWRMRKTSGREFEFEQPLRAFSSLAPEPILGPNAPQPLVISPCAGYSLASKLVHTESGGVKLPFSVQREMASRGSRVSRRFAAARNRQSISEAPAEHQAAFQQHLQQQQQQLERTRRVGSEDSDATALPTPNNKRHSSITPRRSTTSPPSVSPPKEDKDPKRSQRKHSQDDDKQGKQKSSLSGVLKRGLFRASNLVKDYEDRKERNMNGHGHGHSHGSHGTPHKGGGLMTSKSLPVPNDRPSDRSDSASASSLQSGQSQRSSARYTTSESADELADWPDDAPFGSLGLGIEDEQNGGQPWKEGKAWDGVPEEALAMVIPVEGKSQSPPLSNTHAATQPFINPFFVDGPRQALLVWFTPFNATAPPSHHDSRFGSTSTLFKINESPTHEESQQHGSSLALLPKLLRPRANRQDVPQSRSLSSTKHLTGMPHTPSPDFDLEPVIGRTRRESRSLQPLPFKAFRIVAKVVDTEDLRSEPEVPVIGFEQWTEQLRTGKPASPHTPPLEPYAHVPATVPEERPLAEMNVNSVMSGRAFPTVIAVCHSHNTGVEFVLEGLDRLGLCKGESAWGPTGYEEWRGTGLSENGRQTLDLLWAACSAVMGL